MAGPDRLYTEDEYLTLEDAASHKSEFVNGRIYAMSGTSPNHSRIAVNLTRDLATQLRGRPCDNFDDNIRVKVSPTGAYFYPDATALCGEPEFVGEGAIKMLVNPSVVVEILSESTAAFDRGDKFEHYRRIPSLQEYVLIAQDRMFVERHVRAGHFWVLAEFSRPDDLVELASVACTLRVGDLYERVRFPADGARTAPRLVREALPPAYAAAGG